MDNELTWEEIKIRLIDNKTDYFYKVNLYVKYLEHQNKALVELVNYLYCNYIREELKNNEKDN